jgi:hypothetical protein
MTCSQCQAELPHDAAFCTSCGTPAQSAPATSLWAQEPAAQAPAPGPAGYQQPDYPPAGYQQPGYPPADQGQPGYPPAGYQQTGYQQGGYEQAPSVPVPGGPPPSVPVPGGPAPQAAAFQFDLERLTTADRTIGIGSLLTFISLFLPWFELSGDGFSFSESGIKAHGYLALALIAAVLVVGYLVLRAGWGELPVKLPIAHGPLLLVGTGLQLLLVLIAFLFKPAGLSWDFGAYLALIAAIVACAPVGAPALQWWHESH